MDGSIWKISDLHVYLFFFLFLFSCGDDASHREVDEANKSYNSGDKETAKELYLKAADKGNTEAHFAIAYKYGEKIIT